MRLSHKKPNLERALQKSNEIGQSVLASPTRSLDITRSRNKYDHPARSYSQGQRPVNMSSTQQSSQPAIPQIT